MATFFFMTMMGQSYERVDPNLPGARTHYLPQQSLWGKPALSAQVLVQRLRNNVLANSADNLLPDLPILEEKQRGDASNVEAGRRVAIGIHIEFADLDAPLILSCNFL